MTTIKQIAQKFGFDEEDVRTLVNLMLDGLDDRLVAVKEAIASSDYQTIFDQTHSIKGAAANLGFDAVAMVCEQMENAARQEKDIDYKSFFEALEINVDKVKAIQ